MRAVVIADDRTMQLTDIEKPPLGADQVRVRVVRCGICGSDLHARKNPRYPAGAVLGHEIVGRLVEVGAELRGWEEGERVALYHGTPCGDCEMCRAGRSYMCTNHLSRALGLGVAPGGYADEIVVPPSLLHRIPQVLSYDHAALAEPLSISIHGVHQAKVEAGDAVCVLGAGPIGAMAACALHARGVKDVVVVDPNDGRREKMRALGFATVGLHDPVTEVVAALGGRRPIAVLECSGHPTAAGLAVDLVAYTGRVVLQGVPREPIALSQFAIVQKEVELVGAASCTQDELDDALKLLTAGLIPADALVTAVVPLERTQELFDALTSAQNTHMKVLLAPSA